jgi:hypothetical protein
VRAGKRLHKDVARQLAAQARSRIVPGDLCLQFEMKGADFASQQYEMQ